VQGNKQPSAFRRITQSSSVFELSDTEDEGCSTLEMSLTIYHSLQFNLRKPSYYFMHHKLWYSKILRCTHIALMCYVWTLEQTETFTSFNVNRLVLYNQGGRCLLHSTCWVLIYTQTLFIFERLTFQNTAARTSNLALLSSLHSGNQEYGWKITSELN